MTAPRRRDVAAGLVLAGMTLIAVLYVSVPVAATRHIAGGVGAAQHYAVWAVNAYVAANIVGAPLAARLAGWIGRRRACLACIGTFTLATALCGTADSLAQLVAWRVLQGASGGILVPLAQASLADVSRASGRIDPLAAFSVALLIGPPFGTPIGGWLTETYSWRAMFLVGVPIGTLALAFCVRWLPPDTAVPAKLAPFDWTGAALLVVGLTCLEIVLTEGQVWDWFDSPTVVALSAGAAVGLGGFGVRCLRAPDPLVRLELLRDRRFLASTALAAGATCAYLASLSTISRMVTGLMGYAAGNVAEMAGPAALTLLVLVPVLAETAGGRGGRLVPALGLAILAGGALWLSFGNLLVSPSQVLWPRTVIVAGMSLTLSSVNSGAFAGIARRRWDDAAVVYNMFRNLGASLGLCLVGVFLERGLQVRLSRLTEAHLDALNPVVGERLRQSAAWFLHGAAAGDPAAADLLALKSLDALRQEQAQALAHLDALLACGVLALALIPLVFLIGRRSDARAPEG